MINMEIRIKIGSTPELIRYANNAMCDCYPMPLKVIGFAVNYEFISEINPDLRFAIKSNANMMLGQPVEVYSSETIEPMLIVFISESQPDANVRQTIKHYVSKFQGSI